MDVLALPPAPVGAIAAEQPFVRRSHAVVSRVSQLDVDHTRSLDSNMLAARRWRMLRALYAACAQSPRGAGLEAVFDKSPETSISSSSFVVLMMAHFRWPHREKMDVKLRGVYASFPSAKHDRVDYREIVCCMELLRLHQCVLSATSTLLLRYWDVFVGYGATRMKLSDLQTVFEIPALTADDHKHTHELLDEALQSVVQQQGGEKSSREALSIATISRSQFLSMVQNESNLMRWWRSMAYQRLSEEMRLNVCRAQEDASAEIYRQLQQGYQEQEAYRFWRRSTLSRMYKEWVSFTELQLKVVVQERRLLARRQQLFFAWWRVYTGQQQMKRRRRALGNAFGTFAIKSRIFARMKLFLYSMKRIRAVDHKAE
jgi:hypothetical protein